MGTRHLIAVQLDGQYRIAQYGQWDGYPAGQGQDIVKFLESMDRPKFEAKLRASHLMTREELEALSATLPSDWPERYPHFSRDAGSDILSYVMNGEDGIKLKNSIDFAGDGLFCEFGYVIDLDKNTFELFKGFQKGHIDPSERFANAPRDNPEYAPIKLAGSWSLTELPDLAAMNQVCGYGEEEEAA